MDDKLENIKNNFYKTHQKKKIIGVSQQKKELALNCINEIPFNDFINECIVVHENNIFFYYSKIKPFIHSQIFSSVLQYTLTIIYKILEKYNNYNIISDIHSLTMSGIHRCYPLILMFFNNNDFKNSLEKIENIDLHNCPSCIKSIHAFLLPLFKKYNIVSKFRYF